VQQGGIVILKKFSYKFLSITLVASVSIPTIANAQGMPWETPLRTVLQSLQGPTASIILTLAIVLAGLAFAFGEAGSFFRRAAGIIFGGAIAVGAATLASTLFGVGG